LGLTVIEPHPAITLEAIRREREPANQRKIFIGDFQTEKFERVSSCLQTLLRRNAWVKKQAIPR
jgi:hypothetical protein